MQFWKLGNITPIFASFRGGKVIQVPCLDQSPASENIKWITISNNLFYISMLGDQAIEAQRG